MGTYRIVVAHPYQQHSYELAEALRKGHLLYKYITTVYYKPHNLTGIITKFLKGQNKQKALNRSDKRIDSYVIQFCEGEGLFKLLTMRIKSLRKYYETVKYRSSDHFAKKVARFCIKNQVDAVIVYDDTSPLCAEILKKKSPNILVIMDMSAPALPFLRKIYEDDIRRSPEYAELLKSETKSALDPIIAARSQREIDSADYFLVASDFSKKSLEDGGVNATRIRKCVYGVNFDLFQPGLERNGNILHAVFIGGIKQFKGFSYLIKAFENLQSLPVDLTIIGASIDGITLPNNVYVTGTLIHNEVAVKLKHADFAIFPSLGDGFGFGVVEALSAGCPVICSTNTGAVDFIVNGFNGFRIKAQSSQDIIDKVKMLIFDRELLSSMQKNARDSILKLSWEQYYASVNNAVISILSS